MILTGSEIARERANGRITIEPFVPEQVNPNSYNFRLGRTLRVYRDMPLDARRPNAYDEIEIPDEGYVLEPGRLYLAHTVEVLGSEHYAPTFAARSSIARLGIFINLSACLGDIGYTGQWTLQLYAVNRVRVYPGINIGQMMWWRPQGAVVLYDGKYQGAVGPRSSEIHVDFDKQFARQRYPGLGASIEPDQVGGKFANLSAAGPEFRVPAAFCVPAGELRDALGPDRLARLAEVLADAQATVGAFFTESAARIAELTGDVHLPEQARALLAVRLRDLFPADVRLAVRSSGIDEDARESSLAGIHQTLLGVRGAEEAADAIEQCWRSYYEAPAVAARIRAGNFSAEPRLAVIVQAMVEPRWAGVAFTGLDTVETGHGAEADAAPPAEVAIEYVPGLADELVAGLAEPRQATSRSLESAEGLERDEHAVLDEVVAMVRALREARGHDVDVEWAADAAGVHLIQVRPLTARRVDAGSEDQPRFEAAALYAESLPAGFGLGEVAAVYRGYVAKRAPAHRTAIEHGAATGAAWIMRFNGRGLADPQGAAALRTVLAEGRADSCVLDLGEHLRQIVVPKREVAKTLAETTAAGPEDGALHTAIVRDFHRGTLGVISRLNGEGMIVEYSDAGLMALNRGVAGGEPIVLADRAAGAAGTDTAAADPQAAALLAHLDRVARVTEALTRTYGPVTAEWVFDDGVLYFVDYSVLGSADPVVFSESGVCVSPGTVRGPLIRLEDDDLLARLSIGPAVSIDIDKARDISGHQGLRAITEKIEACESLPIVFSARPYAVLSVLIGHVAGFVFDRGSSLGHLAILLREAAVPAASAPGLRCVDGDEVMISDGTVTVIGRGKEEHG